MYTVAITATPNNESHVLVYFLSFIYYPQVITGSYYPLLAFYQDALRLSLKGYNIN